MVNLRGIICISENQYGAEKLVIGNGYFVDQNSIYMDCDGDAYGTVYEAPKKRGKAAPKEIGQFLLKHFKSV